MATLKQQKAINNAVENGGNVSRAMIDAGYSPATAKNPDKLTKSSAWIELMEEHLPDDLLAKKHKELLTTPKKVRTFKKGELESETEELDTHAISKGLELAYKIKDKFAPEQKGVTQVQNNYFFSPKAAEAAKAFEESVKEELYALTPEEAPQPLETDQGEPGRSQGA